MPVDPDVITALETVVAREPRNLALTLHLASLLLDDGRPQEALARCEDVLRQAPADPGALALAARARLTAAADGDAGDAADADGDVPHLRVLPGGGDAA